MIVPNHILFQINFNTVRYLDWAAIVIYGFRPEALWTTVFAEAAHLFFAGMLGVIFLFLLPRLHTKHLYFAGWFYGIIVWFGSYALMTLYKAPFLASVAAGAAFSNFIGATTYGIVLVWAMVWLEAREKTT